MNILIIGGSGFIGSHLSAYYAKNGNHVHIIDNLITGNRNNLIVIPEEKFTFINSDFLDFDLSNLPHFDIAFHLASPASPIQYKKYPIETMRINSEGTYKIMQHSKDGNCDRVILASTSEIYGDPLEHPQKETYFGNVNTMGARSCYDESKRYAESMAFTFYKSFNNDVRIARIFNTYGPNMERNDGRVVSNFIVQAIQNQPITIYGNGQQTRSFCYVSDMIYGLVALAKVDGINGQVINLGNPHEKTVLELANIIKKLTNSKSEIIFQEIGEDDPKKRKPDISKAVQMLNWNPTIDLQDGLNETINYFKKTIGIQK